VTGKFPTTLPKWRSHWQYFVVGGSARNWVTLGLILRQLAIEGGYVHADCTGRVNRRLGQSTRAIMDRIAGGGCADEYELACFGAQFP
jgi:hypothetical protein